jgi:tRNA threonylcarbamoyladenosine biosynthesis protein TsaB
MLLALDTATATASLALYDLAADHLLLEMTWDARRRQTQDLLPTVQRALTLVEATPQAITALAVTTGPGSFTGVRIGISTVKGIGLGLAQPTPVVGLPTLTVTAAPWLALAATLTPAPRICACIQAGRGRYNWAWFAAGDRLARPAAAAHHVGTATAFATALAADDTQPIWLVGECGADLHAATATLSHVFMPDAVSTLRRASQLARLAALAIAAEQVDSLTALQPLYLQNL